jgi:hypothetical protein
VADDGSPEPASLPEWAQSSIPGEPLEQFCECALRTVAAIDKRRNDREPQVSVSIGAQVGLRER